MFGPYEQDDERAGSMKDGTSWLAERPATSEEGLKKSVQNFVCQISVLQQCLLHFLPPSFPLFFFSIFVLLCFPLPLHPFSSHQFPCSVLFLSD